MTFSLGSARAFFVPLCLLPESPGCYLAHQMLHVKQKMELLLNQVIVFVNGETPYHTLAFVKPSYIVTCSKSLKLNLFS